MSDGARCHYCRKMPCECPEYADPSSDPHSPTALEAAIRRIVFSRSGQEEFLSVLVGELLDLLACREKMAIEAARPAIVREAKINTLTGLLHWWDGESSDTLMDIREGIEAELARLEKE